MPRGRPTGPSFEVREAVLSVLSSRGRLSGDEIAVLAELDRKTVFRCLGFFATAGIAGKIPEGRSVYYFVDDRGIDIHDAYCLWKRDPAYISRTRRLKKLGVRGNLARQVTNFYREHKEVVDRYAEIDSIIDAFSYAEYQEFAKTGKGPVGERYSSKVGTIPNPVDVRTIKRGLERQEKAVGKALARRPDLQPVYQSIASRLSSPKERLGALAAVDMLLNMDEENKLNYLRVTAFVEKALDLFGPAVLRFFDSDSLAVEIYCFVKESDLLATPREKARSENAVRELKGKLESEQIRSSLIDAIETLRAKSQNPDTLR